MLSPKLALRTSGSAAQHSIGRHFSAVGLRLDSALICFSIFSSPVLWNSIQAEIKCRLIAGKSCCYSVQTLLFCRLLSKNLKIKIYKTIILSVVLYGCETWFLTFLSENKVPRQIFRSKRMGRGEGFTIRNFNSLYRSP